MPGVCVVRSAALLPSFSNKNSSGKTTVTTPEQTEEQAGFEAIKAARQWLNEQAQKREVDQIRTPSATTVQGYIKDVRRLVKTGDAWKAAADTTKKSTFFKRRAAILFFCRDQVNVILKVQDQLQRANGLMDPAKKQQWLRHVRTLKSLLKLAQKAPAEPPLARVERRQTKRVDLQKLPEDWREQLVDRLPKYRFQTAVTALSGCRPAELVAGIEISIEDGHLVALIKGAKVGTTSGQEWRALHWKMPSKNPLAVMLENFARESGGRVVIQTPNARAFSGAVREAGKRAFPYFPRTITPYSFRHQFASDLKAAELPGHEISKALGHSADKTKGSYGIFDFGRGGMEPNKVEAARAVKQKHQAAEQEMPKPSFT